MPREVAKVVCYVVHDNHLLVFTHDHEPMEVTGVQVPAGSIKPGESPEEAAVRELFEETGRPGQVIRRVGVREYDLRPGRDEIAVRRKDRIAFDAGMNSESARVASLAVGDPEIVGVNESDVLEAHRRLTEHLSVVGIDPYRQHPANKRGENHPSPQS